MPCQGALPSLLTSERLRAAAGPGAAAASPVPGMLSWSVWGGGCCVLLFLPRALLPMGPLSFLPVLTWWLGQWGQPCVPGDEPALAPAAMAAGRDRVQGCVQGPFLSIP